MSSPNIINGRLFYEFNKCPKYNGSYDQCTNNYIPDPNQKNCPCDNRTFEMCPKPFKISEKCYNNHMNKILNKNNDIQVDNENPRVNMWKGNIKMIIFLYNVVKKK